MPIYINIPTYNPDVTAESVSFSNASMENVSNVKQALDYIQSLKVDKVAGKGLSTNDFTDADKEKLDKIESYLEFSTYAEFPNIGSSDTLYVDTLNNCMYIWNDTDQVYDSIILSNREYFTIQSIL